ncbi:hypothetical protein KSS87_023147 [Heliosperma pusillum]|nr:hypothetical protein KSS87_023147 [Heliosperma pusillum]
MADGEEKKHHFLHRNKDKEEAPKDPEKDLKKHKHRENLGKATAIAAGAYALHEKHKAKKDPENASRHKVAQEIATTVAVGAGGLVFHEHHKKKEAKKELKEQGKH